MQTPETEPAPFARGDRVIYRPRPAGIETVELVEYRPEGWPGWYIRTARPIGPAGSNAHRYDRAELFDPLLEEAAGASGLAIGDGTGWRAALAAGLRRTVRCVGCVVLFLLLAAVFYGAWLETP